MLEIQITIYAITTCNFQAMFRKQKHKMTTKQRRILRVGAKMAGWCQMDSLNGKKAKKNL